MNIKLSVGKAIAHTLDKLVQWNYRMTPFIPNGRLLALDLKRALLRPEIIIDVGANTGQTANYLLGHFPSAVIYCFEPVSSVYDELVANTPRPGIRCFNQALGRESMRTKIYKSDTYNGIASINGADKTGLPAEEMIEVITGEMFCREVGISRIDLLKIDTEGYELNVLAGLESMLAGQVKFIFIEVCFDQLNACQSHISDVLAFLAPYGFIPSGFYNPYRLGRQKLKLNHCDLLLVNTGLVDL